MTLYVVMVHGPAWDEVVGIALDVEEARHIVHRKQDPQFGSPLLESEHIAVHVVESGRAYECGP